MHFARWVSWKVLCDLVLRLAATGSWWTIKSNMGWHCSVALGAYLFSQNVPSDANDGLGSGARRNFRARDP